MSTLLLRLAGPQQSWGSSSRFGDRGTGLEPTKSGVLGLVAAALGRPRPAAVDDLFALRFGVRTDRRGGLEIDLHTVLGVVLQETGKINPNALLTHRAYLADADFLAGLEGEHDFLATIADAILTPVFPLCLGRRAFPPSEPIVVSEEWRAAGIERRDVVMPPPSLVELTLEGALCSAPWRLRRNEARPVAPFIVSLEADSSSAETLFADQMAPGSTFADRHYMPRGVRHILLRRDDVPLMSAWPDASRAPIATLPGPLTSAPDSGGAA